MKINTKSIWFIFSPLLTAVIAGYLLHRYRGISGRLLAVIVVIGLMITFVNFIIAVISISKRRN